MRNRWRNINPFIPTKARQLAPNIYLRCAARSAFIRATRRNPGEKEKYKSEMYVYGESAARAFLTKQNFTRGCALQQLFQPLPPELLNVFVIKFRIKFPLKIYSDEFPSLF